MKKRKNKAKFKGYSCKQTHLFMSGKKSEFWQSSATGLSLKGVVLPNENVSGNLPWTILTDRLSHISFLPHDVGGSGDCFFKSVSDQLY